jgi:ketosteroid isomerase-like protein
VRDEVETVRAAFDAFARRDAEALAGLIHPDAELVTATPRRRVARLSRYEGHGGLRRLLDEVEGDWAFYRVTLLEARSLVPGVVLAEGTVVVAGAAGGFGTPAGWIITVSDGRIARIEPYLTREALQERLDAGYARDTPEDDRLST